VDFRYIVFFLLIKIKGIFKTSHPVGTFLLPLRNCVSPFYLVLYILHILLKWFYHMDTILVVLLVFLNFISKVTLLNKDYFCR